MVLGSALAVLAGGGAAVAAPAFTMDLPAGQACSFPLRVEGQGVAKGMSRVFYDRQGNVVRTLSAGTGDALTFTNLTTMKSLALRSSGAVTTTTPGPGDLSTATLRGHNVIILFPTDKPAGPSTTLYVGRVVYTFDSQSNFDLRSTTGTSTDICAALSGS